MVAISRRTLLATAGSTPVVARLARHQAHASPPMGPRSTPSKLTNLDHLNALNGRGRLVPVPGHTTWRISEEPDFDLLWVYADALPEGGYKPVGGGAHDTSTDTWGQGAYDVDDIARAAVVYLRHWRLFADEDSRRKAYEQLRTLAYFQTLEGSHPGEFLLWMQPDGSLNPTPTPPDDPNPADSGDSFWTARCVWALGEGHAAFRDVEPAFAGFLAERMELALTALQRDTEPFGTWRNLHGVRVPGWFINGGADATAEAVLGLSAYVTSSGSRLGRQLLRDWANAIASFHRGDTRQWPHRALLPWGSSLDDWHAWAASMSSALAAAATALGEKSLLQPAVGDTAGFTAQLLTSTGPVNGLLPLPVEKVQIAYGADCRVRACLDTGLATGHAGLQQLAGIAAGWFFGANASGAPVYDPATGVTFDGVEADGRVNRNSGAESTIHGLLTMLALDAHPELADLARASAKITRRDGLVVLEAEEAQLTGGAVAQTPASAWTGESLWSGKQVEAPAGATLTWALPDLGRGVLVQPVVELLPGSSARTAFVAGGRPLGEVDHGAVGPQGDAAWAGRLTPLVLARNAEPTASQLTATVRGGTARIDGVMLMPRIATLAAGGREAHVWLLTSKSTHAEVRSIDLAGKGPVKVTVCDRDGRVISTSRAAHGRLQVAPGGFTIVTRGL